MTCARCTDLCQDVPIRGPLDLEKAVRVIRANLDDGTLVEAGNLPNATLAGPTPFADVERSPPWPDVILSDFHCAHCGEPFRLSCETFHGSGGRWSHGRDLVRR
jgi:hypothetical protein